METNKIHASFLFALVILLLFAGCKSYRPTLFEALSSPAEIRDVGNPFVGVWEMNDPYNQNVRLIYIFTDDKRWASYTVYKGSIPPRNRSSESGTYTYGDSRLYMMSIDRNLSIMVTIDGMESRFIGSPFRTTIAILDGDKLKFARNGNTLRRVYADWQGYEVNPGTTTAKLN